MGMATIGTQGPTLANRTDLAVTGGTSRTLPGHILDTSSHVVRWVYAKRITKSLATTLNVTRCHRKTPRTLNPAYRPAHRHQLSWPGSDRAVPPVREAGGT